MLFKFYRTAINKNIILLYNAIMKNICIFGVPNGGVCKDLYQKKIKTKQ